MFKRLISCLALVFWIGSAVITQAQEAAVLDAPAVELPSAAEIIAKHIESGGGREKLTNLKTSHAKGQFEMPTVGLKGDFSISQMAPGTFSFEMELPSIGPVRRGTDGKNAWEVTAFTGARILKGIEKKQLLQQAELAPELRIEERYDVEVMGIEKVGELDCYKLKCVPKEGDEDEKKDLTEYKYIDTHEHLLRRQSQTVVSSMGKIPVDSYMSDYRDVDGLQIPHEVSQALAGQKQIMKMTEVKINGDLDKDAFALPDDVQKLIKKD